MQAGAGLRLRQTLRLLLIVEHVSVSSTISVIYRKGVTGEHALQPRIPVNLLCWQGFTALMTTEARSRGQRCSFVTIVLHRPVLAPLGGIRIVFAYLDEANEGLRLSALRSKMFMSRAVKPAAAAATTAIKARYPTGPFQNAALSFIHMMSFLAVR
jgi:hypothetical protein